MDTFGDRLKSEREDRGLSIQAVAETLRVDQDRLRALERNDFDALSDEAVMMDCLHAYAECLEVDADLMIEDYVQERDNRVSRPEEVCESEPAALPADGKRQPRSLLGLLALVVVVIAMLVAWRMLSQDETVPPALSVGANRSTVPVQSLPETAAATIPIVSPEPAPELRAITVPTVPGQSGSETPVAVPTASPEPQQPASEAITPESLLKTPAAVSPTAVEPSADPPTPTMLLMSVTEYGVGTAVEDRRLVGGSDRFREGTRVAFWTRVLGGTSGQGIDHVWLRESVEAMRISLDVGGASWRTHSVKTLHQGAAGNWAVEARDEAGRVLARSEFICVR